ncbi:MAG: Jag N-terminal domain-containing protein, partial [Anaerolineae bacterium]
MERRGESVEVRGKTVEEAIAAGLAQLGLSRDQVEVEILSHGSRGLLGIGAEDARVRLTPRVEAAPAEA